MAPPPTGTDRRYGFIRGLSKQAAQCSRHGYEAMEWQHLCRWAAQVALAEHPLPSRHAVAQMKGFGDKAEAALKRVEESKPDFKPPKRGIFCSAAAALLVALLELEEQRL